MKRKKVYELLDTERDYQDMRWNESTTESRGIHTPGEWLVFLQDYLTEAMHKAARLPEPHAQGAVMAMIRKITAMGVCAMEQNGCQYLPYLKLMVEELQIGAVELLHEFFNYKSDANKYLLAEQQEDLEKEFREWLNLEVSK